MKIQNINIRGINTVVPRKVVDIENELDKFNWSEQQFKKIVKQIGIKRRHVVTSETTLDLMEYAAKEILNAFSLTSEQVDIIICVTQTPDFFQPNNACILHGRLGGKSNCISFDINLGCSGYVYGLSVISSMMSSLGLQRGLLLCGDTISKCVDPNDQKVAPLFGDAASATLLEQKSDKELYFSLNSNGSGAEYLMVDGGAFKNQDSKPVLKMDGNEIMIFSIKDEPKELKKVMQELSLNESDIDHLILHQANSYIIANIAKRVKFPLGKVPHTTISRYGNTSSASIPTAINDCLNNSLVNKKKKVLFSGFGVGLSWGTCYTELELEYCPNVLIYE